MEYPKTENLYASNGEQNSSRRSGPEFGFRAPGVEQISKWLVTEKVDGTNIRIVFETIQDVGSTVRFAGRTDRAQIPGDLRTYLEQTFTLAKMVEAFRAEDDQLPNSVVLFGEGFGPGIQKAGSAYGGTKRFILFDVAVDDWWLSWGNVEDVARKLSIPTVPVLGRGLDLDEAKDLVGVSELLPAGSEHIEGVVVRTDPYLFDQRGHRVAFKYKVRDLA